MSDKKRSLLKSLVPVALLLVTGLGLLVLPVRAEEPDPGSIPNACLACHEDLYYRFDTGKHYCLTEAAARCVDCHAGDSTALLAETAHAGLVAHPIPNGDISRCTTCHAQDAELHVDRFAALAGFSPSVQVAAQAAPLAAAMTEDKTGEQSGLRLPVGLAAVAAAVAALLLICQLTQRACRG